METSFSNWLIAELEKRNMSQAVLTRNSGVTPAQISRIINGTRGAESKTLMAIANALKLPPEEVYRAAGLLPPAIDVDEEIERIIHEVEKLPPQDREEVLAFIRMKKNLRKKP